MSQARVWVRSERDGDGVTLTLGGHLDSATAGTAWREAMEAVEGAQRLVIDASAVTYCDGAGVGLLVELRRRVKAAELRGLNDDTRALLDQFADGITPSAGDAPRARFVEEIGRTTAALLRQIPELIRYVGELSLALGWTFLHPRSVRWKDAFLIAEMAGVKAVPIISLIGLLLGLILAFQAAAVLQPFGAQMLVADSVGIALLRELGPLMTAIVLAGRSGAAFAAELGTMKVNEEISALSTMGLSPVRFLVVPRVIAAVAVTPLLAIVFNLVGLVGGAIVFIAIGFPLVTYFNQLQSALDISDLLGGLFKAFVFGIVVAAIGCLRGLQTGKGARAVGEAATSAVVSGLVLIIVGDGLFAVVFHVLGL